MSRLYTCYNRPNSLVLSLVPVEIDSFYRAYKYFECKLVHLVFSTQLQQLTGHWFLFFLKTPMNSIPSCTFVPFVVYDDCVGLHKPSLG